MTVTITANHEKLSRQAADIFVQQAQLAVREKGRFCVALSGGDTPIRTYELLCQEPWVRSVPWNETHIFWGDERCVPFNDPRHNAFIAKNVLLSHVPVPEVQIHPVICVENPTETALKYENLLKSFFPAHDTLFDLMFLGIGKDGHIASLFPGTPVLEERERWVTEVAVPGQAFNRITVTYPVIEKSTMVLFLVSGYDKANVIGSVLGKDKKKGELPASRIRLDHGECIWLLDKTAGSKLLNSEK
ncbi:MAG: 6-phosphogluconolactonase [Syntrophothermus sp.]